MIIMTLREINIVFMILFIHIQTFILFVLKDNLNTVTFIHIIVIQLEIMTINDTYFSLYQAMIKFANLFYDCMES